MSNGNRTNSNSNNKSRQNMRPNPNHNYGQNQSNNNNYNQNYNDQNQEEQSSNQLQLSVASRRALDLLKKARASRSAFMIIGPNERLRLQFDPTKSRVEKKDFNGQSTERIAHSVINMDDRAAGEKNSKSDIQTKSTNRRSDGTGVYSHGYYKNWRRIQSKLRHKTNRIE